MAAPGHLRSLTTGGFPARQHRSSLHRRTSGTDEERALLANWPIPRRNDWPAFLNRPQPQAEEFDIIQCTQRSRPYGDPAWQSQTAQRLGLTASLRPKGRPKWKQPANPPEASQKQPRGTPIS